MLLVTEDEKDDACLLFYILGVVQLIKDIGDIKGANSIRSSVPIGPLRKWDLMNYSSKARHSVLPSDVSFSFCEVTS